MGYFSNSTENEIWKDSNCYRCKRYDEEGPPCPVEAAHFFYNYKQLDDDQEALKNVLDLLIPRAEDGLSNEQCSFFESLGEQLSMLACPHHQQPTPGCVYCREADK